MELVDYLIVGSGLTGAVVARELTNAGKSVHVIERREHVGGNCYSENFDGLPVCKYGGHIFHTNSEEIWKYVQKYSEWLFYQHKVVANYKGKIYSFPINLATFDQLWGISNSILAKQKILQVRVPIENPQNFEEKALSTVGEEIYQKFFYHYTKKQWGIEPRNLPASILSRIPIRYTFDDSYFSDQYQAMPLLGYTFFFNQLLKEIKVDTKVDFGISDSYWYTRHKKIIYTGMIDEFYQYCYGPLGFRSLKFDHQPNTDIDAATMNFTGDDTEHTRIISFNHFYKRNDVHYSVVEFPSSVGEPYYPIPTQENKELYRKYQAIENDRVIFCGRLGSYQYLNMDQAIAQALSVVRKELVNGSV